MTALARELLDVPVVPDASTARRWATDELANPIYHQGRSLLARLYDWFNSLFENASTADLGLSAGEVAAIVVLVALVVAGIAFWVAGPVRRARRATGSAV
ncbi:MAG TPA: hypothetical protein VIM26_04875, partial [Pengzhenrongella sp.]